MTDRLQTLRARLAEWGTALDGPLGPDTPLISSGRLDSTALASLILWVEEQTGQQINPANVDIVAAWDTPERIVRFIESRTSAGISHGLPDASPTVDRAATPPVDSSHAADDAYEFARASAADVPDIARLQTHLWSPDPDLNARRYRWKYEQACLESERLVSLVRHTGRAVGMRGFCMSRWEGGGTVHGLYTADDLVIEPEHRGRGLFERLHAIAYTELARRGCRFVLSLSALHVTRTKLLARGGRDIGTLAPIGRIHLLGRLRDATSGALARLPLLWRLAERLPHRHSARASFALLERSQGPKVRVEAAPRPTEMAALIRQLPFDGRIRMVRDERFFAWRFLDPLHEYRFAYVDRDAHLAGYLVLERALSPYANQCRINLIDWEAEDVLTAAELLEAVVSTGAIDELVTWSAALDSEKRRIATRLGFVAVDAGQTARGLPTVVVYPLVTADEEAFVLSGRSALDHAHWDMRPVYTSLV
jgi:acyl carrier protein/GNAT superfamily N-acetyltransferase